MRVACVRHVARALPVILCAHVLPNSLSPLQIYMDQQESVNAAGTLQHHTGNLHAPLCFINIARIDPQISAQTSKERLSTSEDIVGVHPSELCVTPAEIDKNTDIPFPPGRNLNFSQGTVTPQNVVHSSKDHSMWPFEESPYRAFFLLLLASLTVEKAVSRDVLVPWPSLNHETLVHTGCVHGRIDQIDPGGSRCSSVPLCLRSLSRKRGRRKNGDRTRTEPDEDRNAKRMIPLKLIDTYEKLLAEYLNDQRWRNEQHNQGTSAASLQKNMYAPSINSFNDLLLRPPLPPEDNVLLGGDRSFEFVEPEALNMDNYKPKQFFQKPKNPWRETQKYENAQRRQMIMSSLEDKTLDLIKKGAYTLAASVEGASGGKSKITSALTTVAEEAEKLVRERGDFSGYINVRTGLPCIPSPEHIYCVVRPTSTSTTAPPTFLDLLRYKHKKEEEEERQRIVRSFLQQEEHRKTSYGDPYEQPVIYSDYGEKDVLGATPVSSTLSRFTQEFLGRKWESYTRLQNDDLNRTNEETVNTVAQLVNKRKGDGSPSGEVLRNQHVRRPSSALDAPQEKKDLLFAAVERQYRYQNLHPLEGMDMSSEDLKPNVPRKLSAAFLLTRASEQLGNDRVSSSQVNAESHLQQREEGGNRPIEGSDRDIHSGNINSLFEADLPHPVSAERGSRDMLVLLSPGFEGPSASHGSDNDDAILQDAMKFQDWIMSAAYLPEELTPFRRGTHGPALQDQPKNSLYLKAKQKKQEHQQERLARLIESFTAGSYAEELLAASSTKGETLQPAEALTGPLLRMTAMPPFLAKGVQHLQDRKHDREVNAERRREKRWEESRQAQEAASLYRLEQTLRADTFAFLPGSLEMMHKGLKQVAPQESQRGQRKRFQQQVRYRPSSPARSRYH